MEDVDDEKVERSVGQSGCIGSCSLSKLCIYSLLMTNGAKGNMDRADQVYRNDSLTSASVIKKSLIRIKYPCPVAVSMSEGVCRPGDPCIWDEDFQEARYYPDLSGRFRGKPGYETIWDGLLVKRIWDTRYECYIDEIDCDTSYSLKCDKSERFTQRVFSRDPQPLPCYRHMKGWAKKKQ